MVPSEKIDYGNTRVGEGVYVCMSVCVVNFNGMCFVSTSFSFV